MSSIAQITETLQAVLVQKANRLARTTGFIQRKVKWDGYSFIQTLMLGFLSRPDASYSQLGQTAAAVGVSISNQGLEQRFTERAADFFPNNYQGLAAGLIEQLKADGLFENTIIFFWSDHGVGLQSRYDDPCPRLRDRGMTGFR